MFVDTGDSAVTIWCWAEGGAGLLHLAEALRVEDDSLMYHGIVEIPTLLLHTITALNIKNDTDQPEHSDK